MKSNAAKWWYMKNQSRSPSTSWAEFVVELRKEFIPQNSNRQARDQLRKRSQRTSVAAHLNEFQNTVISIPGLTTVEMSDRFVAGLKPQTIKLLKAGPKRFLEASSIALKVEHAVYSSFSPGSWSGFTSGNSYAPMDIGNVNAGERSNSADRSGKTGRFDEQRQKY
eukprot:Plantae.Rhodophyta-Palmaria_palmata.ctg20823.p1 GENE.Plantae.Rhodophyta-Palmaria_palmata.ctg20823~~Plantae.Rhodophyta-Palmaria_palmata.ctg20823.p1  ORF type:complete len:166 (-),score=10.88 Plantae.Rhodophyta-Palmaria_palmata.ctg20823:263-760(-)